MKLLYIVTLCFYFALGSGSSLAEIYKYQDANGKWHFTDSPPRDQETTAVEASRPKNQVSPDKDLKQQLHNEFSPGDPIEEATLSVVTVNTKSGNGSGFFVSDDGYIVTNRHVVRPATSSQWKQQEAELEDRKTKISNFRASHKEDAEELKDMKGYIDEHREYFESNRSSSGDMRRIKKSIKITEISCARWRENCGARSRNSVLPVA